MKKGYVRELKAHYDEKYALVHQHLADIASGAIAAGTQLELGELKLMIIEGLRVPIKRLDTLVMEQLQVTGRPRPMLAALVECVNTLNEVIVVHNKVIQLTAPMGANEKVPVLFAVQRNGVTDETFKESVKQIYDRTDDCIWFGAELMTDLGKYGQRVEPKKWLGKKKYRVVIPKFDDSVRAEFFPPDALYKDWIDNFKPLVGRTKGRPFGKFGFAARKLWRRLKSHRWARNAWTLVKASITIAAIAVVLLFAYRAFVAHVIGPLWRRWVGG
jgi:hypothetical protein